MIRFEIIGDDASIASIREEVATLCGDRGRLYRHRGSSGPAGISGLLLSILPSAIPSVFGLLKSSIAPERNMKIVVKGFEINVRSVREAGELIDLLKDRGLLEGQ